MNFSKYYQFLSLLQEDLTHIEKKPLNFIIKLIIAEKFLKGIVLLLLSLTIFPLFSDEVVDLLHQLASRSNILSNAKILTSLFTRVEAASDRKLLIFSLFFLIWGTIELAESLGLSKRRRWAEYLAVVSTSLFIPIELFTVLTKFSIEKFILLLFNIFLVYYLLWSRKLFIIKQPKSK